MIYFYLMLILGALFIIFAVFSFIAMYVNKDYPLLNVGKSLGMLLIGVLFLTVTLPSLKYVVLKEYDVISGECVIEIVSSGRSSEAVFTMLDTDRLFYFRDIPALDAYGKSIPYYCMVTATKDHMFEVSYKIYDSQTRKLIVTSK
ncbi:hypothetical protein BKP45_08585 [Anaerobacillus alkalidiazotrophicus]|uniref:Uncharacterized protein n=1 Tax=Anaerobacillus alkalidiazotrophicus TaxID=472963 RepID=A0A1S2M863_9BACI|nr:hypothetical protein [Anaerobacillus alkalidiazotrophicus]OIJ20690.1 hypothetical protein BKP45_08585 [Anaerobacillus alkalidiazotrophicus]